ncbi:MAG: HlyD family efflux transporter periplasmic adaptor subunit, partial [Gammaproteobacteria bacterium]
MNSSSRELRQPYSRFIPLWRILPVLLFIATTACTPDNKASKVFSGYVTADWLYVSATNAGKITQVMVKPGDHVTAGQPLVALDDTAEQYLEQRAEAEEQANESTYHDLVKGARPEEIAAIEAEIEEAKAKLKFEKSQKVRWQKLVDQGLAPKEMLDEITQRLKVASAHLKALQAKRKVAELGARDDQQAAALARVKAAKFSKLLAQWQRSERTLKSPEDARVEEVFYYPGEVVGAGTPVLALLSEKRIKVRFYIPEKQRANFHIG